MSVRTRFAPSPTGYLHIGGVRTALFNWLLARQAGGQFILRIDDTDQQRNIDEALQPILDGFRWLGIDWDEGPEVGGPYAPYYQSQRGAGYQAAVKQLLSSGAAYRDYATSEETQSERQTAEKEKRDFLYSRKWMAETEEQAQAFEAQGRRAVVRLKMPREGACEFTDLIRGDVTFDWAREQDHVIQRADGTCLYHLASVVDDHDLRITHVVRAVEHLSNTPRQIFIAESLGYELPHYAHIPFVAEPGSHNKLSKRKIAQYLKNREFKNLYELGLKVAEQIGEPASPESFNPVLVDFYRKIGFLPEAIVNYLLLLGWSLDGQTEFFSRDEMTRRFSLERVVKSEASFDPAKLLAFQAHYMGQLDIGERIAACIPFLQAANLASDPITAEQRARLESVLRAADDRVVVSGHILQFEDFFVDASQLKVDEKAFAKRIQKPPEAGFLLGEFKKFLGATDDFSADHLETTLKQFVEGQGIEIGEVIHALRVALTGKAAGFGVFDTMAILGRQECLKRIDVALEHLHHLAVSDR